MPHTSAPDTNWTVATARETYLIDRWGGGYFDINAAGEVVARPLKADGVEVSLPAVVAAARQQGLQFPLVVRFQDILRHRVAALNAAFAHAIAEYKYENLYRGVFPIKVNQLAEVVEEIIDAGRPYRFGLEVGSKPELFAGLALLDRPDDLLICNGYKDALYVRMALLGIKLGKQVILVVEKLEELTQIIAVSRELGVTPHIGLRARLLSKGTGKWAESGGEASKFGLSAVELFAATEQLRAAGLTDALRLLHFHIGSQVTDIRVVKKAVQEAARYYAKLYKMGFPLQYVDVGGGLGVDYDGSHSPSDSSTNYGLQEYANDVVYHLGEVATAEGVPHPTIVSESGRALTAHHSVLITEAFGATQPEALAAGLTYTAGSEHPTVADLLDIQKNLATLNKLEAYHDARDRREEAHNMFLLGLIDLSVKAKVEALYGQIGRSVVTAFRASTDHIPEEILELEDSLGDRYLCNFSLFQSLPDSWAVGQLFPVMPIHRLNEEPTREATLADITCDSDGKVSKFIDLADVRDTLPVHALPAGGADQPYYLGFFLLGAYQDIMGDQHNLFGRVNELHIFLDPDEPEGWYVEEVIRGATVGQSLSLVEYDPAELKRQMKTQVDKAIREDRLKPREAIGLLGEYERGLSGYTYLGL